jgi:hypothetical protein
MMLCYQSLQLIINILKPQNIKVQNLTNYFFNYCKEVNLTRDQIDLVDLNGNLKGLKEVSLNVKSALELLQPRETYILVDVKPTEIKNYFVITPLLYNSDLITTNFLKKLQPEPPKQAATKPHGKTSNKNNPRSSVGNIQLSKSWQNVLTESNTSVTSTNSNKIVNYANKLKHSNRLDDSINIY